VSNSNDWWEQNLMVHGWPECGPGSVCVDDLYNAFKARLIQDLVREGLVIGEHQFKLVVERVVPPPADGGG
jgi:hypothetical protein